MECRKLCRDYHARMYATIGEAVVVYLDNYNVFVSKYDMRYLMRTDNGAYYSFEKDVNVDEAIDYTNSETEAGMHDQYIGAELQLPDKYVMKWMERFRKRLRNADVNP